MTNKLASLTITVTIVLVHPCIGQEFSVLHHFGGTPNEPEEPMGKLVRHDGVLYGTSIFGGIGHDGTVYRIRQDGTQLEVLHEFVAGQGKNPMSSVLVVGSELYGATLTGGRADQGTLYRLNINGTGFETIHEFSGTQGNRGQSALISDGTMLFGTTRLGGANGHGTVFRINFDGSQFTKLHDALGGTMDGGSVQQLLRNGSKLYAGTGAGGSGDGGVIFELDTDGSNYRLVHEFERGGIGGSAIFSGPTLVGESLFGTTAFGGDNGRGIIYRVDPGDNNFEILHDFAEINNVTSSWGHATQLVAFDNRLYGLTERGGVFDNGTIYEIQLDGTGFRTLYEFGNDEGSGNGTLTLLGSELYGTRLRGGLHDDGTLFRFQVPEPSSGFLLAISAILFTSRLRLTRCNI